MDTWNCIFTTFHHNHKGNRHEYIHYVKINRAYDAEEMNVSVKDEKCCIVLIRCTVAGMKEDSVNR